MVTRYGTNDIGSALVDAIPEKHEGYVDITKSEWEDLVDGINSPPKTFDRELAEFNEKYNSDFNTLLDEYNRAVARDGVTESVKVNAVRSKMTALDVEYDNAFTALLIKYS